MSRQLWAVWITCPSLQSLALDHFYAFYYAPSATHDYVLHNQDDSHGIVSGIHGQDASHANLFDDSDIVADRIYL